MQIGIATGAHCSQILAAVLRRTQVDAEIISPEGAHSGYDIVLAVNDEPVPPGNDVRRYVTQPIPEVSEWTVVAARHLLPMAVERGVATPIAVPMPVEFPGSDYRLDQAYWCCKANLNIRQQPSFEAPE